MVTIKLKSGELLETSLIFLYHNVAGNGKRDGLKNRKIEQSAAKLLKAIRVWRRFRDYG